MGGPGERLHSRLGARLAGLSGRRRVAGTVAALVLILVVAGAAVAAASGPASKHLTSNS